MDDQEAAKRLTMSERVSIRAVLVPHGGDVADAMSSSGITDPIALPFVYAGNGVESSRLVNDPRTPNLVATLEMDQPEGQNPARMTAGSTGTQGTGNHADQDEDRPAVRGAEVPPNTRLAGRTLAPVGRPRP